MQRTDSEEYFDSRKRDAKLMADVLACSPGGVEELYSKISNSVLYGAPSLIFLQRLTEDVKQDTFLVANARAGYFEAKYNSLYLWLHKISRNVALKYWAQILLSRAAERAKLKERQSEAYRAKNTNSLESQELKNTLRSAMKELPIETRTLIAERFIYNVPLKQIAEMHGITLKQARKEVNRGLVCLRKTLKEKGYEHCQ